MGPDNMTGPARLVGGVLGQVEMVRPDRIDRPGQHLALDIHEIDHRTVTADPTQRGPQRESPSDEAGFLCSGAQARDAPHCGQRHQEWLVGDVDDQEPVGTHVAGSADDDSWTWGSGKSDGDGPSADVGEQSAVQGDLSPLASRPVRDLSVALEAGLGVEPGVELLEEALPSHAGIPDPVQDTSTAPPYSLTELSQLLPNEGKQH